MCKKKLERLQLVQVVLLALSQESRVPSGSTVVQEGEVTQGMKLWAGTAPTESAPGRKSYFATWLKWLDWVKGSFT